MAGIRSFNTNLPHVFRYPEWTEGLFYPAGSVVSVEIIDSDVHYDFYAAINDIDDKVTPPNSNREWRLLHDAFQIDSDLIGLLLGFDSELQRIYESIDSEELARQSADSDIRLDIDSDIHALKSYDSDFDSEVRRMFDSERHDWKAGDSDIHHRLREIDSDLKILFSRTDSDEDALQAIRSAVLQGLDSEIHARLSADSDFDKIVTQAVHDYLSNDSEHDSEINELKVRLDSDFDAAVRAWGDTGNEEPWGPQPFVSNTDFYIDTQSITNHLTGWLWLVDHQNGFIYLIRDGKQYGNRFPGDLLTTVMNTGIFGEFTRGTQITDGGGGADVNVYTAFGDALPIATNANLYTVIEKSRERAIFEPTTSMDDALRRTVSTVVAMDSDLHELMYGLDRLDSDNDSDHIRFYHDIAALDSEQKILKADRDSDNLVVQHLQSGLDSERHDWKAGDSDVMRWVIDLFGSDVGLTLEHDSELFIQTDSEERARRNADSDIYNKYHGVQFRYVRQEHEAVGFTANPMTIDFDGAGAVTSHSGADPVWVWNPFNDRLVLIDSDANVFYNEIHNDEPVVISIGEYQYRRGYDTLASANINVDSVLQGTDDVWGFHVDHITKYPNGGILTTMIDSDVNLHDRDSDYTTAMVWLGYHLADVDSDLRYLEDVTVKFRGTVDPTFSPPAHTEVKPGDLYISRTSGSVAAGWDGIVAYGVSEGNALLYTDSDKWIFLGAGGGADSDTISSVPSIAWIESTNTDANDYRRHQDFKRLTLTSKTKSQFIRDDSDNTWLTYGEAPYRGSSVLDAEQMTVDRIWISTQKAGPKTKARINLYREYDDAGIRIDSEIYFTGDHGDNSVGTWRDSEEADSDTIISLIDSEVDAFGLVIRGGLEAGASYYLKYEDLGTNEISYLRTTDGTHFRRFWPWEVNRKDHDSDLLALNLTFQAATSNGYPVGSIIAFAHQDLPPGFRIADGSAFDRFQFPDLYQKLGTDRLPDLRNQFLRGYNDGTDGFGNARAILSQQDGEAGPHKHFVARNTSSGTNINTENSITRVGESSTDAYDYTLKGSTSEPNVALTGPGLDGTDDVASDETRPTNVMVLFGIAMYSGAGLVYDSDIVYNVMMDHFIGRLDSEDNRLDSEIHLLHEHVHQMSDSDRHDSKAGDSDILAMTGRRFVQNTIPNPTSPDLRDGDTWIDTDDHRLYYYRESIDAWVQVLGTV